MTREQVPARSGGAGSTTAADRGRSRMTRAGGPLGGRFKLRWVWAAFAAQAAWVMLTFSAGPISEVLRLGDQLGLTAPDLSPASASDDTYRYFTAIGAQGRNWYEQALWIDMIAPVFSGTATALGLLYVYRRLRPALAPWLMALPAMILVGEWGENGLYLTVLQGWPLRSDALMAAATGFTSVKAVGAYLGLAAVVGGALLLVVRRLRGRGSD